MMRLLLACVLSFTPVAAGQCASASCFGSASADPLIISGTWNIASGATLDFGPRHVILAAGATLSLGGPVSITAAKLTAQAGSLIDGTSVTESDVSITTTPAGAHDGSATLSGTTNLHGPPSSILLATNGGDFALTAGGAASVSSLDTSAGNPGDAGNVTIIAPSITIGTIVSNTNHYYSTGAVITLTSGGPVTVGAISALTSNYSSPSQVTISGTSYTQAGNVDAAPYQGSGWPGWAHLVSVNATGPVSIQGQIRTGDPSAEQGGSISITAGGALSWTGAVGVATGFNGGSISLRSLSSDVVFSGSLVARTESDVDYGGVVSIQAAGHLDFTGTVDLGTAQTFPVAFGLPPLGSLDAGRTLRIRAGSVVQARDLTNGCASFGGFLSLTGCRIVVEPGASVDTCGTHPVGWPTVSVAARDLVRVDGAISAGTPPGEVSVTSRLPWQAAFAGAGAIAPAPVVTVAPMLPPCAAESTLVAATSPVTAGQPITVSVTSQPLRPLLVLADFAIAHLPLGPFGWTQVNLLTAHRIADDLGILGAPIPGSTDPGGNWSWSLVTPVTPVLSNVDVHFDVYVVDYAALNGLFQQAPAIIHFN